MRVAVCTLTVYVVRHKIHLQYVLSVTVCDRLWRRASLLISFAFVCHFQL